MTIFICLPARQDLGLSRVLESISWCYWPRIHWILML